MKSSRSRSNPFRVVILATVLGLPGAAWAGALPVASDVLTARPGVTLTGKTSPDQQITIAIAVPSRDPAGAEAFVQRVGNPKDKLFRHYLTPTQFAAKFGANDADYAALVAWANEAGLTPTGSYAAHNVLVLRGAVSAIEKALGVSLHDYTDAAGRAFYAADGQALLPATLAGKVDGIVGLSSQNHGHSYALKLPKNVRPLGLGSGLGGTFSAADLRTIYSVPPQISQARTQTVALFEYGGFTQSDVAAFWKQNNVPPVPVSVRGVNGYGGGVDDPGVELEAVLDIDMVSSINPRLKQILVYEDGVADSFQVALLDSLAAIAQDDTAQTVSISYGQDEHEQGGPALKAEHSVLVQLAAQGQAVFASSGDTGAYGDEQPKLNVSDPASQPYLTAVGGTTVLPGPNQSYLEEQAWNELNFPAFLSNTGLGATGGGISSFWALPSYQKVLNEPFNQGSATRRNVPDVAAVGDPLTGVAVYSAINGGWIALGGTSVSSPVWAGFYSVVNEASETLGFGKLGFANPLLYSVANLGDGYGSPDFNDVFEGSNGSLNITPHFAGYFASRSYDNTTGWGSPIGGFFLADALTDALSGANPPPQAPNQKITVTATSVKLTWGAAQNAIGYVATLFNVNTGAGAAAVTTGSSTNFTGLSPNTNYAVTVQPFSKTGVTLNPAVLFTTTLSN
jgi:kumamolisin